MNSNTKLAVGALAIASLALIGLAVGCARHEDEHSTAAAGASQTVVAASSGGAVTPQPGGFGEPAVAREPDGAALSSDSLPPDVVASLPDTLVAPGSIIEITAKGSPDVVEVTLADGIGKRQKFVYDPADDLWRASYRVPMRSATERLGLSVTAKNGVDRWRRVWLFLSVPGAEAQEQVMPEIGK